MNTIPRYSHLYLDRPENLNDSEKMRFRISKLYEKKLGKLRINNGRLLDYLVAEMIEDEAGIPVITTYNNYYIAHFLDDSPIHDFLDCITFITVILIKGKQESIKEKWITSVENIFRQEGMAYTLDSKGIVHPYIDACFLQNNTSTLSALSKPRYETVRTVYESANRALRSDRQDTRIAVKDIFESLETLTKLIVGNGKVKRLGATEVKNDLTPICIKSAKDEHEEDFIKLMLKSFEGWVNAHHIYRHGQENEKFSPPSLNAAVLSVSTGSSYLRFLTQIDDGIQELA